MVHSTNAAAAAVNLPRCLGILQVERKVFSLSYCTISTLSLHRNSSHPNPPKKQRISVHSPSHLRPSLGAPRILHGSAMVVRFKLLFLLTVIILSFPPFSNQRPYSGCSIDRSGTSSASGRKRCRRSHGFHPCSNFANILGGSSPPSSGGTRWSGIFVEGIPDRGRGGGTRSSSSAADIGGAPGASPEEDAAVRRRCARRSNGSTGTAGEEVPHRQRIERGER